MGDRLDSVSGGTARQIGATARQRATLRPTWERCCCGAAGTRPALEHQLQAIAEAVGIALGRLPTAKSSPDKVLLAALLKQVASVSNRWLGERLDMGAPGSVSSLVTRFHRPGLAHTAEFRAFYSRFAT
jgi:hypothetical protein